MKSEQDYLADLDAVVLPLTREWIEIIFDKPGVNYNFVLPLTREWIETLDCSLISSTENVLPLTREWIEIFQSLYYS